MPFFKMTMALAVLGGCITTASGLAPTSMWQILKVQPSVQAWKTIFGEEGERGEYMDGYTQESMLQRCREDYKWEKEEASERAAMMSHLYDNERLWEHVSMVAFAEHYLYADVCSRPFETFSKQKRSHQIFSGVVMSNWQTYNQKDMRQKLEGFQKKGMDYVRLECNFGSATDIGGATQLADNTLFCRLAQAARECQKQEMVPLVLIQVPWREPGSESMDYFEQAVQSFATAVKDAGVDSQQLLLETRPPIAVSASKEQGLSGTARIALGLQTGQRMFEAIQEAFDGDKIAGFCVAGGSTKGEFPTAMQDDCQNAVRQGMRQCAKQQWGYELCFWEMGAKLMLQPKVGQLWGANEEDAARELFSSNAKELADEIKG